MVCEYPFDFLASLTWASIDLIALEVIFARIFKIDKKGNVHVVGSNQFQKTAIYVFPLIIFSIFYWYMSNSYQDQITSSLCTLNYKIFPALIGSISFSIFWITKVNLGRKIEFPMTWVSLLIWLGSLGMFIYLVNWIK